MLNTRSGPEAGISIARLVGWIGSPGSRSIPLIIFLALYPAVIGYVQEAPDAIRLPIPFWLWDLSLGFCAALVVLVSKYAIRRHSLKVTVLTWTPAALAGAVGPILVCSMFGVVPDFVFAGIPISVFSNLGLLLLFTILQEAAFGFRSANKKAKEVYWKLQNRETWLKEELRLAHSDMVRQVFESLDPEIERLSRTIGSSANENARAALRNFIDEAVRPLSRGLENDELPTKTDIFKPRVGFLESGSSYLKRRVAMSSAISPGLPVIFSLLFFLQISTLANGWSGLIHLLVFLVISSVSSVLILMKISKWMIPYVVQLVLNPLVSLIVAFTFFETGLLVGLGDPQGLFSFLALGVFLVFAASGFISLYVAAQEVTNNEIAQTNESLTEAIDELQHRLERLRTKLAQQVHGDIQSTLQATLLRLSQGNTSKDDLFPKLIEELQRTKLTMQMTESLEYPMEAFEDLHLRWQGICDVTISMDELGKSQLTKKAELRGVVFEIARERVLNAIKHSSADELDMVISVDQEFLIIRARNRDYSPWSPTVKFGLGSTYLERNCDFWNLKADGDDLNFEAHIRLTQN